MTQPRTSTSPADEVPVEELRRVVARFDDRDQVVAAGYVFGAESARVGDAAVLYSRGAFRAGVILKIGRVNVTVVYTTETAIREAADPRYGWTEPARTTKAAKFADTAVRPTRSDAATEAGAAPASPGTASRRINATRQLDHNHECVGCGAHHSEPCHPACPFETGVYAPAVLLRAAARRLREHRAGVGYDIGGALFAAALDLVGRDEAADATDGAREILTGYLVEQWGAGAEATRSEVVYRHGLFTHLPDIARSLYAAAARHDGIDVDTDAFGDFPV
jgi:hypothetical protein